MIILVNIKIDSDKFYDGVVDTINRAVAQLKDDLIDKCDVRCNITDCDISLVIRE